jgi:membrane dipeptidase
MSKKNYNGYRSYQYLEPGVDYKPFRLVREIGRVESLTVEVSPAEEERAQQLLETALVVSLHDHPFVAPENMAEIFDYRRQGRDWTGYQGLAVSHIDVIFDNFMDGTALITSHAGWKWTDIIHDLGMRLSDLAHQTMIYRAETVADLLAAKETGRIALVPALEAATPIENEIDRVDVLYGLGVRMMGITYSEANALGSGLRERTDAGLTELGRRVVRRMNKLGMAIDIAHCGDQTSLDTIAESRKPVFISHAGARALWPTARMKPDEVLRACAAKGGIIGIEAAPHTTLTRNHPRHSIESVMEHFEYIVNLVGIDHVAFGPDTLFGDHVALHRVFAEHLSIQTVHGSVPFPEVPYVAGLENPSETFPHIVRWLVHRGYSDDEIIKVLGGNVIRVLREVWWS